MKKRQNKHNLYKISIHHITVTYKNLEGNLMAADPTGRLYDLLYDAMMGYRDEIIRLESERRKGVTGGPQVIQLEENVSGRFQDLQSVLRGINHAFRNHQPPLQEIPTDAPTLNLLVDSETDRFYRDKLR